MPIVIDTFREGYGFDQISKTMTVKELIEFLQDFDEDEKVYLGFDRRWTYGGIREGMFECVPEDKEVDE